MIVYTFEVTGSGNFPVNMLSALRCWPESDKDSKKLIDSKARRRIRLSSFCKPNKSVWSSYGWFCNYNDYNGPDDYNEYHTWPC